MVPDTGLEPVRPNGQRILSAVRLPISPLGQMGAFSLLVNKGFFVFGADPDSLTREDVKLYPISSPSSDYPARQVGRN